MGEPEIIIHVVDDDKSFLTAISRLLRAAGHTVRTFSSAAEFLAYLTPTIRGCLVADLQMPGVNGLELQAAMSSAGSGLPVVFLTGHGDIPTSVRAMRNGAEDFLVKLAPKEKILEAIERALARERRERDVRIRALEAQALLALLSPREGEVLERVLQGKLNKQIAAELFIDERTVKFHRTNITTKLRVNSVVEMARLTQDAACLRNNSTPASN